MFVKNIYKNILFFAELKKKKLNSNNHKSFILGYVKRIYYINLIILYT